jgi:hypothetical protein
VGVLGAKIAEEAIDITSIAVVAEIIKEVASIAEAGIRMVIVARSFTVRNFATATTVAKTELKELIAKQFKPAIARLEASFVVAQVRFVRRYPITTLKAIVKGTFAIEPTTVADTMPTHMIQCHKGTLNQMIIVLEAIPEAILKELTSSDHMVTRNHLTICLTLLIY